MQTGKASRPIAITCPRCDQRAEFGAPYAFLQGEEAEQAIRTGKPGVRYGGGFALERYPRVFPWSHPKNPRKTDDWGRWGVVVCAECALVRAHRYRGHAELWYRVDVAGRALVAMNRAEFVRIYRFLKGPGGRDLYYCPCPGCSCARFPAHFQTKRNRRIAVRAIERFLGL